MRFLANENFPLVAVEARRAAGHDVAWIHEDGPGATDHEVLARGESEDRILLTFDKNFGELVFRSRLSASSGVILFRIAPVSPSSVARAALAAVDSRRDWKSHFSVVEEARIRMTRLA